MQRVLVARVRARRDAAVQHCFEYLGCWHTDFEPEGSVRSVVLYEGVLPEAAPCMHACMYVCSMYGHIAEYGSTE